LAPRPATSADAIAVWRTDGGRAPEVPQTVNREEMGKLSLTAEEEKALVAFMKTLSDGPDAAR